MSGSRALWPGLAGVQHAQELYEELASPGRAIVSMAPELDGALSPGGPPSRGGAPPLPGGLPLGAVTEAWGPPGAGKTALVVQLALNVQVHGALGGVAGLALVLDCEGGVAGARAAAAADALARHVDRVIYGRAAGGAARPARAAFEGVAAAAAASVEPARLLAGVTVARVTSLPALLRAVAALPGWLAAHADVRFVAVDGLPFHWRYDGDDAATGGGGGGGGGPAPAAAARARALAWLAQALHAVAVRCDVAVLVTNHAVDGWGGGGAGPALGDAWASCVPARVGLRREGRARFVVTPTKHALLAPHEAAAFSIREEGVRAVPAARARAPARAPGEPPPAGAGGGGGGGGSDGAAHAGDKRLREDDAAA